MPALSRRLVFFILMGLLVYSNSLFNPFVHDDLAFIRFNPQIANLAQWPEVFFSSSSPASAVSIANTYYRPLLEIVYRLLYRLLGFNATGYHLFNVIVHISNSILVFFIVRIIFKRILDRRDTKDLIAATPFDNQSWVVASVFLVHPVQTEAVACIAGMSNLIFAFFCLLSLLLFLAMSSSRWLSLRYFFCLVFFFLALLVKEQAIFLPLLIVFCSLVLKKSQRLARKEWLCIGGFFCVSLLYLIWRKSVCGVLVGSIFKYKGELLLRLAAIPQTLIMYVRVLLFPVDLHYYRSINILNQMSVFQTSIFLSVIVFVVIILKRMSQSERTLAFLGLGWFILALLPVLNFIPIIHEYSWIAAFEHFLYFPIIGFLLFFSVMIDFAVLKAFPIKRNRIYISLAALVIMIFAVKTYLQNNMWKNEVTLFRQAVAYEEDMARPKILLAKAYLSMGHYELAREPLNSAAAIMNGYLKRVEFPAAREVYLNYLREINFLLAYSFKEKAG